MKRTLLLLSLFAYLSIPVFAIQNSNESGGAGTSANFNQNRDAITAPTPCASPQPTPTWSPLTWPAPVQATLLAGLITTLTGIAGFIWGLIKERKNKQELASANKTIDKLTDRLGFKIRSGSLTAHILDANGSSRTTWSWEGVQIIRQGAKLSNIPGEMWYSPANANIIRLPEITRYNFNQGVNKEIQLTVLDHDHLSCEYQVEITGALFDGQTLDYELVAEVENGFFMKKNALDQAPQQFKREYWGYNIVFPVDKLQLNVIFPKGYTVATFPGVCLGDVISEKLFNSEELQRIDTNKWFERGPDNDWARLTIEEPVRGLSYFIYWTPLP